VLQLSPEGGEASIELRRPEMLTCHEREGARKSFWESETEEGDKSPKKSWRVKREKENSRT